MAELVELKEKPLEETQGEEQRKTPCRGELKEFDKLDSLLTQIPKKAQHGILKTCDLVLTCIDANSSFIALGTNVGLTFLFARKDDSMQRLKSTNTSDVITCVRLHHGLDDQLATGTASGDVIIFCIPGPLSVQKKQIQKFDVKDVHRHYITCLEWSTNGMKLYSGDKSGQVASTEVDFYQGQCKSIPLLLEPSTEIVQLDYGHKVLLVSTRQRSFIVRLDEKSQIVSIGTKERKIQGRLGACFLPGLCKTTDAKLYAARPGCRLWLSDMKGIVQNTYIFPDPLSASVPEIPLLSTGKLQQINQVEFQFGILKLFNGKEIVTWSSSALVVIDPESSSVVAQQGRLSGIVDVAVVEDQGEIFLLRRHAEARVIRIADKMEAKPRAKSLYHVPHPTTPVELLNKKEEEKGTEQDSPALSTFFKKLTNPLLKKDKIVYDDNKQVTERNVPQTPEPIVSSVTSPDLPPVVQLASPELDYVRVFVSGSSAPTVAARGAVTSTTIAKGMTNFVATETNSVSSQATPTGKVEKDSNSHHFLDKEPVEKLDDGGEGIVFSHRMKKHKKKKHKGGLQKEKDDDVVSQLSVSSQHSDEINEALTPNNTPAIHDTPLDALKHADNVLSLVENILRGDQLKDKADKSESNLEGNKHEFNTLVVVTDSNQGKPFVENLVSSDKETSTHLDVESCSSQEIIIKKTDEGINEKISRLEKSGESDLIYTGSQSQTDQHTELKQSQSPQMMTNASKLSMKPFRTSLDILDSVFESLSDSVGADKVKDQRIQSQHQEPKPKKHQPKVVHQEAFQDIYGDIEEIEAMDPFKKGKEKVNPADDFYSKYMDTSPESPEYPSSKPSDLTGQRPMLSEVECNLAMQDITERRLANSWSEFMTPTNIYSLVVTATHIWFTDKSENIYYSSIGGPKGIVWRKASGQASQISVSPSGHIVWRLHRGEVYAGTKISSRHPEGLKWVEAVKDVEHISVDDTCAWYIKRNGEVMMQRSLSMERPCFKSRKVECRHKLKHIVCRHGVVWAVTEGLRLVARTGVSDILPEGNSWQMDSRDSPPYLFSNVAIDNENIGWAIDVLGQIWFCNNITQDTPLGCGQWWQVPMGEYILHDESTLDMIKSVARKFDPKQLSYILSTNRGGLITAGSQGVWLALDFKNVLQVCRGSIQGFMWLPAHPAQMSVSSTWKLVSANISHLDWGLIWAQHTNGDLYTFKHARSEASMVPETLEFCCISAGPSATWAVTPDGDIKVRAGTSHHCPQGTGWVDLDLSQLGDAHIVHLSCNALYVWAVESDGGIYQRIGAKPPSENNLSPVWLPIDTFADIVFTKVYTGPLDWMVWAIDNRRLTYVRNGVTDSMPIGQEWVHVPGIQAIELALTNSGVWALTPNGDIFFRYSITRERPCGNYWKKIPGTFIRISGSANDELWGINTEGQLMQCSVKYLHRQLESNDPLVQRNLSTSSSISEDVDWEIV